MAQLSWVPYIVGFQIYSGSWDGEDEGTKGQRSVWNQPTIDVCFHGSNKYTNSSRGTFLFVYFVFYFLLKNDLIEETCVAYRKCVHYQIGTHLSILKLYSTNFWLTCLTCMMPTRPKKVVLPYIIFWASIMRFSGFLYAGFFFFINYSITFIR